MERFNQCLLGKKERKVEVKKKEGRKVEVKKKEGRKVEVKKKVKR
jgi:uncharacterized protein Veg